VVRTLTKPFCTLTISIIEAVVCVSPLPIPAVVYPSREIGGRFSRGVQFHRNRISPAYAVAALTVASEISHFFQEAGNHIFQHGHCYSPPNQLRFNQTARCRLRRRRRYWNGVSSVVFGESSVFERMEEAFMDRLPLPGATGPEWLPVQTSSVSRYI